MFRKKILDGQYEKMVSLPRFGLETFLNQLIIKNKSRVKIVFWPRVHSPEKFRKYGLKFGITSEIGMYVDILKTEPLLKLVRQIIKILNLKVK